MIGIGLALGGGATQAGSGAPPPAPAVTIGFDPARDAGTDADLYVAPAGDDADPGTQARPKRTIQAALDAAAPGQTVAARAGTYRERVSMPAGVALKRHGAERVVVSGQDVTTGWTACDASDDALLGAARPNCYKLTLPLTAFVGGHPRGAWPHEAGVPLLLAADRLAGPDGHFHSDSDRWLRSGTAVTMADPSPSTGRETWHLGIADPDALGDYSAAQVLQMDVFVTLYPNVAKRTAVESFDAATGTLYLEGADPAMGYDGTGQERHYQSNHGDADAYALLNALPRIAEGGWGWSVAGADATLYVWPADPANLASGLSVAARGRGIQPADGCVLEGIEIEGQASAEGGTTGDYPIHRTGGAAPNGVTIRNCAVRNYYNGAGAGYGAVWQKDVTGLVIDGLTIEGSYGAFGLFVQNCDSVVTRAMDTRRVEKSPWRYYGVNKGLVSRSRAVDCGFAAHANKTNIYEGGHQFVWHACDLSGATGYLTWQETSSVALVNCRVPASYLDGRGIVDQNKSATLSPADQGGFSGASYLIGVETPPYPRADSPDRAAVTLGQASNPAVTFTVRGSILHGVQENWAGAIAASSGNVSTNAAFSLPGDTVVPAAEAWEDAGTGDWRTPAGSPLRALPPVDVSADIAAVKGWLTHVPRAQLDAWLDTDLAGGAVDWTARPPGARATLDAEAAFPPLVVDLPAATVPTVGVEIGGLAPFVVGEPRPAVSHRWQSSGDGGAGWSDIAGAAALAYTPAAGEEGALLRRVTTVDGVERPVEMLGPVAANNMPQAFFSTTGAGPYFKDPTNVPAGTSRIRHRLQLRVPAGAAIGSGAPLLVTQESQGFDVSLTDSGDGRVNLRRVENEAGANVTPADKLIWEVVRDVWTVIEMEADFDAGLFRFSVDGGAATERPLGGAAATFQTAREIGYLGTTSGGSLAPAGLEIGLLETWFTTGGTETLRQRIEGDAAAVNAHPWKRGGDAV